MLYNIIISSPLDQFQVYPVLGFSLTNLGLSGVLALSLCLILGLGGSSVGTLKATFWKRLRLEGLYISYSLVKDQLNRPSRSYFGLILTIFVGTTSFNVLGLVPYSFTLTSHIVITFALSFPIFTAMTLEGLYRHKIEFFSLFLPAGTPLYLIPLLTLIEAISYIARLASLAIRLGANIIAGHVILKIIAGVSASLLGYPSLVMGLSIVPLGVMVAFTALEFAIAFLQSYVLCILTCNYLNDGISLH